MNWLQSLFAPSPTPPSLQPGQLVLALLVAFIVGQLNAWCYKWTHRGVSYSRTFTQALVLIAVIAAMSMSLVASNALIAVGLLGGLAIIRFRTVVRDARDTAYVFLCLMGGMAAGFGFFGTAVVGSVAANLVAAYLHATGFGAWHAGESLLRFRAAAAALRGGALEQELAKFCRRYNLVSVDESPGGSPDSGPICQCAYKLRLRRPEAGPQLVATLKQTLGIEAIHLLVEQEYEEVA